MKKKGEKAQFRQKKSFSQDRKWVRQELCTLPEWRWSRAKMYFLFWFIINNCRTKLQVIWFFALLASSVEKLLITFQTLFRLFCCKQEEQELGMEVSAVNKVNNTPRLWMFWCFLTFWLTFIQTERVKTIWMSLKQDSSTKTKSWQFFQDKNFNLDQFEPCLVKICWDLSNLFKTCQNLLKLVKTCWNLSRLVKICQDLLRHVQTCQNLSKLVKICWNLSRLVKICCNLSRLVETC